MSTAEWIEHWAGIVMICVIGCAVGRYIGRALGSAVIRVLEATGRMMADRRVEGLP